MGLSNTLARQILRSQNGQPPVIEEEEAQWPDLAAAMRLSAAVLVLQLQPVEGCELPGLYVAPANSRLGYGVKTNGNYTSTGEIAWAATEAEAEAWAQHLLSDAADEVQAQDYTDHYGELPWQTSCLASRSTVSTRKLRSRLP